MHSLLILLTLFSSTEIDSNRAAIAAVDRAVAARKKPLAPLSFEIDATIAQLHQSRTPQGPYLETKLDRKVVFDPGTASVFQDDTSVWPDFTSRTTTRIRDDSITTVRHAQRSHQVAAGAAARRTSMLRQHPDLLLDAASRRRASLRATGESIHFAAEDGTLMTLSFREDKLRTVEWIAGDPFFGDVSYQFVYEWSGGEPAALQYLENGRVVMRGRYREVARGGSVQVPPLDIPPDFAKPESGPAPRVELVALAERVHLVRNAGGPDYHSLLVAFDDHFVVVEAPRSTATANAAIAAIRAHDATKPIRAVVVTHHHDDHIGGLRAYAAIGAKIITTADNVDYLRRILTAPHTIGRADAIAPETVAVRSGHRWKDGVQELVLFDAGPTEHVEETLVAWLPAQRIVFQGDLFRYDPGSPEAARASAVAFGEFIQRQKLAVQRIVGTHGEPAELAHLETAIERRRGTP